MKTLKITLTQEQRVQLAHAATLEIDLPDYDQVVAERDNAWRELRDIRKAIDANPEESTLDEVNRILHTLRITKTTLGVVTALLNPNGYKDLGYAELLQQRMAEAACEGFKVGVETWFAESHTVIDVEKWKCNRSEEFASRRYLPNKKPLNSGYSNISFTSFLWSILPVSTPSKTTSIGIFSR